MVNHHGRKKRLRQLQEELVAVATHTEGLAEAVAEEAAEEAPEAPPAPEVEEPVEESEGTTWPETTEG